MENKAVRARYNMPPLAVFESAAELNVPGITVIREILESDAYKSKIGNLVYPIGRSGEKILVGDLSDGVLTLVCGSSGCGKTVLISTVIGGLLARYSPEELELVPIDFNIVSFDIYEGLPHMRMRKPIYDVSEATAAFERIEKEAKERLRLFAYQGVSELYEFNRGAGVRKKPYILVVIDEAAELLMRKEASEALESMIKLLAGKARGTGIHIILSTQRSEMLNRGIKKYADRKFVFPLSDIEEFRALVGDCGAAKPLRMGEMVIVDGKSAVSAQAAYVSNDELIAEASYIREHNERASDEDIGNA